MDDREVAPLHYSARMTITEDMQAAIMVVPADGWTPAHDLLRVYGCLRGQGAGRRRRRKTPLDAQRLQLELPPARGMGSDSHPLLGVGKPSCHHIVPRSHPHTMTKRDSVRPQVYL